MLKLKSLLTIFFIVVSVVCFGQFDLRQKLEELSETNTGLNNQIQVTLTGLTLADVLNTIALENNLNFVVDPELKQRVSYNFFDVEVIDVLVLFAEKYNLDVRINGNIISIAEQEIIPVQVPYIPYEVDANYNPGNQFLTVDLKNDTLSSVVKKITEISDLNVYASNEVRDKLVTGYFLNRPILQVLGMLAESNNLKVEFGDSSNVYITKAELVNPMVQRQGTQRVNKVEETGVEAALNINDKLILKAVDQKIAVVIAKAAEVMNKEYFFYELPEEKITINIQDYTFDELLTHILQGGKYSFLLENEVYLIGDHVREGLRVTELIRMQNRTIENVSSSIPAELMTGVSVKEFPELNGFIVSGARRSVEELKRFLSTVDVIVPMVQIDVMILLTSKDHTVSTGISAGIGDESISTGGILFPELDVQLGAQTLNDILAGINGFGIINLGQLTPNFYLSLQALENNNIVNVESTPKLATLNGNEASITIGEVTYYQQETVQIISAVQNQNIQSSKIWTPTEANLQVLIKPFVSSDDKVTLTISLEQTDFAGKVDPTAPPNKTTQTFESMVRVNDGEVILLGGLEKKSKSDAGSGVPILSRIPIIKWFFSSRTKTKEKSKLHILIKTTVFY